MSATYAEFLASKRISVPPVGIDVPEEALNPMLFDWQREIVRWALARGRAAIWSECGTGKTGQQLEFGKHVSQRTGKPALILAPLAVTHQTRREGDKFGVPVTVCRSQSDVQPGVNVTNYEMLEHFDPSAFGAWCSMNPGSSRATWARRSNA